MATANSDLIRAAFEAFLRGDTDALRDLMDPGVQWLWYEAGEWDCHDREKVLRTLAERQRQGVVTGLDRIVDGGEQVFVEVTGPTLEEWGLPEGRASVVVTVREGKIVRLQDHRSREEALAGAGLAPQPRPAPPAPPERTEPGWDRVSGLCPFVHVADIDASIAFYRELGFAVQATHPVTGPRTDWAYLAADGARLMLARSDAPVDAGAQAVLFYLYARDLFALRERLVAAGLDPGEIRDGTPGPKAELRIEDPDGYVLMIAQITEDS
jgi:ketosteroid isomerase-like protein